MVYEVGIAVAIKQLGQVIREVLSLRASDRRHDAEIAKLQNQYERLEKVQYAHGCELEFVKQQLAATSSLAHGLKSKLGKEKKKNERLEEQVPPPKAHGKGKGKRPPTRPN